MLRIILGTALMASAGVLAAQTLQLITEDEARLPAATQTLTRAITRGPGLKLLSPEGVNSAAFGFKVAFEPRSGSKIDLASVQVVYLKTPQVDLTARVKAAISPEGISLPSLKAPVGEHPIRISIRDDEGRQSSSTFTLVAR